ncbi:hypothetical protein HID58_013543, partial [Brassica napus]
IEFVAHSADPAEADAHWVALCNVEEPTPEPWVPVRPFSERVVGRTSRLDQASVAAECLPSFRRLWGVGGNVLNDHSLFSYHPFFTLYLNYVYFAVYNPIPPFPEDLCIVWNLLRGGPLFWGYFSPERVRAAVETHRSRFSSSIDDDMGVFFEGTSLPAVYAMQNRPLRIPSLVGE